MTRTRLLALRRDRRGPVFMTVYEAALFVGIYGLLYVGHIA